MKNERSGSSPKAQAFGAPVLIVETGERLSVLVRDFLPGGTGIETTGSGLEALRRTHAARFTLAVVDADVEKEPDGIETAYWLRRLYGVPVILVSARGDTKMRLRAAAVSPDAFLVRSPVKEELRALVTMIAARRSAVDAEQRAHDLLYRSRRVDGVVHPAGFTELTGREWQVLLDVIDAPTAQAVALKRGRSPHTVHNQFQSIFRKLEVHSLPELFSLLLRVSRP